MTEHGKDTVRPTPTVLSFGFTMNTGWTEIETEQNVYKIFIIKYWRFIILISAGIEILHVVANEIYS